MLITNHLFTNHHQPITTNQSLPLHLIKTKPMKKFTFLIAVTVLSISASAQTYQNAGFEVWVPNTETAQTYQMPQRWLTVDVVITFFNELFGNPGYTVNSVSQTSSAHSGNYAAQMSVAVSTYGDTVGGVVYYCNSADDLLMDKTGFPFAFRPANYTGWYKWNRVGGDTCGLFLIMTKWNTTTQSRDTVAYEENFVINPASAWTQYSFPISYIMNIFPDTIFVAAGIASSNPNIGSVFTVDDFAFSGTVPIGINEGAAEISSVSVFPNPSNGTFTISAASPINTIEIYNVLGEIVYTETAAATDNKQVNLSGQPAGIYLVQVLLANGKRSVSKISVR